MIDPSRHPPLVAEVLEVDGVTILSWKCDRCGALVERSLAGTPWYCSGCGYHDRDVELDAEGIVEERGQR